MVHILLGFFVCFMSFLSEARKVSWYGVERNYGLAQLNFWRFFFFVRRGEVKQVV